MAQQQAEHSGDGRTHGDSTSNGVPPPEQENIGSVQADPPPSDQVMDEVRCKALLEVLTSIIWVTDPKGRFVSPQPRWGQYTGQNWQEQKDSGWLDAVHPDDREQLKERLDEAFRDDRLHYFAQGRIWHAASGSYRHHEARGVGIRNSRGEVSEWIGTCKDVHDQRCAEQALLEADRAKDEFISIVSHELRNPLAPIGNAAYIVRSRGAGDLQLQRAAAVIERQVAHMSHLLNDLLDVQRIRENKIVLRKSRVTLDSILDAAVEVSRPVLEERAQHLELCILATPLWLEADAQRLTQAISNVLTNAAKYTPKGGRVTLTARRESDVAVITVKDTGVGIPAEMLLGIFDLFSQASPTPERFKGGLGIGLALVKRMVELHDGTVVARSEGPGLGSEFVIRLPLPYLN